MYKGIFSKNKGFPFYMKLIFFHIFAPVFLIYINMESVKILLKSTALTFCIVVLSSATMFAQEETGVVINGVRWATGYFDMQGKKLKEEPKEGIYIIRYDNGKTKKVMKSINNE